MTREQDFEPTAWTLEKANTYLSHEMGNYVMMEDNRGYVIVNYNDNTKTVGSSIYKTLTKVCHAPRNWNHDAWMVELLGECDNAFEECFYRDTFYRRCTIVLDMDNNILGTTYVPYDFRKNCLEDNSLHYH